MLTRTAHSTRRWERTVSQALCNQFRRDRIGTARVGAAKRAKRTARARVPCWALLLPPCPCLPAPALSSLSLSLRAFSLFVLVRVGRPAGRCRTATLLREREIACGLGP
jgi:hypothetical protein